MKLFPGIAILCAAALAAGCSSVVNSHRQKEPMLAAYMAGDNDGVTDVLKDNLKDPNWYNTSVVSHDMLIVLNHHDIAQLYLQEADQILSTFRTLWLTDAR